MRAALPACRRAGGCEFHKFDGVSRRGPSHRGSGVSLLHQDVSRAIVDVLEAVRSQQDPSVPPGHDHHDVAHVQDLSGETKVTRVSGRRELESAGRDTGGHALQQVQGGSMYSICVCADLFLAILNGESFPVCSQAALKPISVFKMTSIFTK